VSDGGYHKQMVSLARGHYDDHIIVAEPNDQAEEAHTPGGAWLLSSAETGRNTVAIRPLNFGRLLVHGACDPIVFGGYSAPPEKWEHHPIIDLIGKRDEQYLEYVLGKVIPRLPDHYVEEKAEVDLAWFEEEFPEERYKVVIAEARDRFQCGDWRAAHNHLYENLDIDYEYIGDVGKVLAPPQFYYAVFAVKRLWELLKEAE
jgi:hypothetical protein